MDTLFYPLVAVRWVHFVSLSIVFGASLMRSYAPRGLESDSADTALVVGSGRAIRMTQVAAIIAATSGLGWLAGTIANATGGPASLADPDMLRVFFLETPFGLPALIRLALFAALLVIAAAPPRSTFLAANLAVSSALLVSQAWLGHAAEGGNTLYGAVIIVTYAVHVLAAATWTGGLPSLALAMGDAGSAYRNGASVKAARRNLLRRYSAIATVAVVLVVASGFANTVFHASLNVERLAAETYGRLILTKVALLLAMLVPAALNRFVFMPRLDSTGRANWLCTSIVAESALATLVFAAAAILGISPPQA